MAIELLSKHLAESEAKAVIPLRTHRKQDYYRESVQTHSKRMLYRKPKHFNAKFACRAVKTQTNK